MQGGDEVIPDSPGAGDDDDAASPALSQTSEGPSLTAADLEAIIYKVASYLNGILGQLAVCLSKH